MKTKYNVDYQWLDNTLGVKSFDTEKERKTFIARYCNSWHVHIEYTNKDNE